AGSSFGRTVAALGNYILVGAPYDDRYGLKAGAVYLFDARTGQFVSAFYSRVPHAGEDFGFSLAPMQATSRDGEGQIASFGDSRFAVGAPGIDEPADFDGSGNVYIYDIASPLPVPAGQVAHADRSLPQAVTVTVPDSVDGSPITFTVSPGP